MKTIRLASVLLVFAAMTIDRPCPASEAGNGEGGETNLLTAYPRLKELITEANRASGPAEIRPLTEAGVDTVVVQKYVEASSRSFSLDADQIIELHERGVGADVLTTMLRKKP